MLEVNVWYATDKKGVVGKGLVGLTTALARRGNIGHINLTVTIHGSKKKLKQIEAKYPMTYVDAPRKFKTEKLPSNSPYLGRMIDAFHQRGEAIPGISLTHSFWPSERRNPPNILIGLFGKRASVPANFLSHTEDMINENYDGGIERIVHMGPNTIAYQELEALRESHLEQMGAFLKCNKTAIAIELYQFLNLKESVFQTSLNRKIFLAYEKENKCNLSSSDFALLADDLDSLSKRVLNKIFDIESDLMEAILSSVNCDYNTSEDLQRLIQRIQAILALPYYSNDQVETNPLTAVRNTMVLQIIDDIIAFYLGVGSTQADVIANLKVALEKQMIYLNDIEETANGIKKFEVRFKEVDAMGGTFIKKIADISNSISEVKSVVDANEQTVGRPPDASFELVTHNDNNFHYIDEEKLLAFIYEQTNHKEKEDNKYDIIFNNCAHNVKRCIINAIPEHTREALKQLPNFPKGFFNINSAETPKSKRKLFQHLKELEYPGTVEDWLHQLNVYLNDLNRKAMADTDKFLAEMIGIDKSPKNGR